MVQGHEVEGMGLQEAEGVHVAGSLPHRGGSSGGPQVRGELGR